MEDTTHELWLAELHPAERPRYFDGQLLTAKDFQEEQDYWRRKLQLHNRFGLGRGVVCGLGVTTLVTAQESGVRVSAGLALDGWGREIVVPTDIDIVPMRLFDGCDPLSPSEDQLPASVHISVSYRESTSGRQPVGIGGTEQGAEQSAAGRIVEGYCVRVREGPAPEVSTIPDAEVLKLVRSGRLHDALCLLTASACPTPSADPCVVLANVAMVKDGSVTVDACGPRAVVATNRLLTRLANSIALAGPSQDA